MTDGHLLEQFLARRDEAAFDALVGRHGGMVLRVCQRVLRNAHDAEDAFQASFLVLVRKGPELRHRPTVANWLYGVAYHTALKARAAAGKRRAKERQASAMAPPEVRDADDGADVRPLLDAELCRLPEHFRAPVVLYDLEGKTRKEAARSLGCPEGTVASRLARAHALLARRLARRGVALSAAALAREAAADVPASLARPALRAALSLAAGETAAAGGVPAPVAGLADAVLRGMFLVRLKAAALAGLAAVALFGGLALPLYSGRPAEPAAAPSAPGRVAEAEAVLDRAIRAAGGEAALAKLQKVAWRGEAHFPALGPKPVVVGGTANGPDRWVVYATVPVRQPGTDDVLMTFKVLGTRAAPDDFLGFQKAGQADPRGSAPFEALKGRIRDAVDGPGLQADLRALRAAQLLLPLRDRAAQLSPAAGTRVEGRPAAGIAVAAPDLPACRFFFDEATGRPCACVLEVREDEGKPPVTHELSFGAFRDFDGVPTFARVSARRGGRPWFEFDLGQLLPQEDLNVHLSQELKSRYRD